MKCQGYKGITKHKQISKDTSNETLSVDPDQINKSKLKNDTNIRKEGKASRYRWTEESY